MVGTIDGSRKGGSVSAGPALGEELEARIAALGHDKRALLLERIATSHYRNPRLIGCVTATRDGAPQPDAIRRQLAERLPAHMLPHQIHVLDALPRTGAGKVDRAALVLTLLANDGREPVPPRGTEPERPLDRAEATLAAIWADVLGIADVGVDEDFFELGGDSLLSIRILARARKQGLIISPEVFFDKPTVAQQAEVARADSIEPAPAEEPEQGAVPLLPIQHWFFERVLNDRHHWNQQYVLRAPSELDSLQLGQAVTLLVQQHDALRARFVRQGNHWEQDFSRRDPDQFVEHVQVDSDNLQLAMRDALARVHAGIDLGKGPLFRVVLVTAASGDAPLLGIVAHHLVVDAISWGILLEDLQTLCRQLLDGATPELPSKTTSAAAWSHRIATAAELDLFRGQLPYWMRSVTTFEASLPGSARGSVENDEGSAQRLRIQLPESDTARLMDVTQRPLKATVYELLLTALAITLRDWCGRSTTLVDLEGHGREPLFDQLDVSRTVGWFTTVFPFPVTADSKATEHVLQSTQRALRSLPTGGLGFGVLRHFGPDDQRRQLNLAMPSELCFNYLGSGDSSSHAVQGFVLDAGDFGAVRSPRATRAYLVDVNAWVEAGQLVVEWAYNPSIHESDTIAHVAGQFTHSLTQLLNVTPAIALSQQHVADFPLANLSETDLSRLTDILDE